MLNTIQRLMAYTFQNCKSDFPRIETTPKQRRRIEHKANKQAARVARIAGKADDAVIALEMSCAPLSPAEEKAYANVCPRCKVKGGDSCVTPTGKATKTHKGRGE